MIRKSGHRFSLATNAETRLRGDHARTNKLVPDHHRRPDEDAAIEVGDVLIGHAEAAGGDRLSDRLRLVRAVNAIERRTEIDRAGAKRVVDTALHVARQIWAPR